jgi:hypothetical protein
MQISQIQYHGSLRKDGPEENFIEIEKKSLRRIVDRISSGECRYPLLAIRILIHAITNIESDGKVYISARQLSKSLDVHYSSVTKCLRYLRSIEVIQIEARD